MKKLIVTIIIVLSSQIMANQKTLVISDIDDTIKASHVKDHIDQIKFSMYKNNYFMGLNKLYHQLLDNNDNTELAYVTNAYKWLMGQSHSQFIKNNGFPNKKIYFNSGSSHKINTIASLIEKMNPSTIVLIGDNAQKDSVFYYQIQQIFSDKTIYVFIRNLYREGDDDIDPIHRSHFQFTTTLELSTKLYRLGLISDKNITEHLENFNSDYDFYLNKQNDKTRQWIPNWANCSKFIWPLSKAEEFSTEIFQTAKKNIFKRCYR